ncbi:hypothetical protein Goshw_020992, partial [Gossypium schwendimanii]|nr:hypothetical protein [Gossypium schwendimanii]
MGAIDFPFGRIWKLNVPPKVWNFSVDVVWNDKVFERASTNLDIMLFHSKIRALMWARVVHEECQFLEGDWWPWLEVAGCAGVLREEKGVACALFLGRVEARGTDLSEIMVIKIAVDMYTEVSRKAHVPFIIKSCSTAASKWLSKRYCKLWSLRKFLGDINCGTKQLAHFQIAVIDRKSNGMVDASANA